jgi:hypothetical protein
MRIKPVTTFNIARCRYLLPTWEAEIGRITEFKPQSPQKERKKKKKRHLWCLKQCSLSGSNVNTYPALEYSWRTEEQEVFWKSRNLS